MAVWYQYRDFMSRLYFDGRLKQPHRDAWSRNKLNKYLEVVDKEFETDLSETPKHVWLMWFQGMTNAPDIIKKCYSSVCKYLDDYEITVIDDSNIEQFVKLPEVIKNKWKNKEISPAHYSDMVRLNLLIQNGGIWIDATCMLTSKFPSYIERSNFFMFKACKIASFTSFNCSNWFIKSPANNPFLVQLNRMLVAYHKTNMVVKDYFVFHQLLTLLSDKNESAKKIWDMIPYVPNSLPHVLQFEIDDTFSQCRFEEICAMSSIHKLTYKFEDEVRRNKNNFYNYIFR